MSIRKVLCIVSVAFVICACCTFNAAYAVDPVQKPVISDVALSEGGRLEGQVIGNQNTGLPGVPVSLKTQDRDVAQAVTDANGRFVVQDLRGGVYRVDVAQSNGTFRLWAPRTAPPAAGNRAVVYVQNGNPAASGLSWKGVLGNPLIIPAVIATAVAVPIAVSSHHSPASP